jgi:hypothetical protein
MVTEPTPRLDVIPAKAGGAFQRRMPVIHVALCQDQIGLPLDQPAAVEKLFAGMTSKTPTLDALSVR